MTVIRLASSRRYHPGREIDDCPEAGSRIAGGCSNCPELLKLHKEILELVPPFVHLSVAAALDLSVGFRRKHFKAAALFKVLQQPVGIEGLVADRGADFRFVQQTPGRILYTFDPVRKNGP